MIEEHFRKIKNEELLRIFPIKAAIDTQKLTEDNKDLVLGYKKEIKVYIPRHRR